MTKQERQKKTSLENWAKMEFESFKNALRLHIDSFDLFKNKSFPSAYFLSILALEEFGKSEIVDFIIFHSLLGNLDNEYYDKWINSLHKHQSKQNFFSNAHHASFFDKKIISPYKDFEKNKQNAVYVGIKKGNNHLIIPFKFINYKKTKCQLVYLNDVLFDWSIKEKQGISFRDNEKVHKKLKSKKFSRKIKEIKDFLKEK